MHSVHPVVGRATRCMEGIGSEPAGFCVYSALPRRDPIFRGPNGLQ